MEVAAQPAESSSASRPATADALQATTTATAEATTTWSVVKQFLFRLFIMYAVMSFFRGWRQPTPSGSKPGDGPGQTAVSSHNLIPRGTLLDFHVYISEVDGDRFNAFDDPGALFWHLQAVPYGQWTGGDNDDGTYTRSGQLPCPESVRNNGSLYIHVYITKAGHSPNPANATYQRHYTMHHSRMLNKYKKKRYQKTQNLLTGKTEASPEEVVKAETTALEILSHWHPNLTINLVDDQTAWVQGTLPPPLDEAVRFEPISGNYYPIFFFNDFWNLAGDYQAINDSVRTLNFTLSYSPMSLLKWQIYAAHTVRNRWTSSLFGMSDLFEEADDDQDSVKQALLDTNPYLLALTFVVSVLHTIFEFLALKNDVQFWRNNKSLEGLSVRSVLFNILTSLIVLLYVFDNETNFIVRFSVFVGLLIELWKIPKCMVVKLDREHRFFGVLPRVTVSDRGSYVESSTKVYDMMAFKYLSWVLFPLLAGYAVYSLLYQEHRGWYSWLLNMLYGFLLTFGFIMMTPQLFINYKLKSVAHLPWRMLTYKFLNTFIDDIFAFVIKMPTMYRIGCFRDDIVFLIYVYQRWIYRVDMTRLNEFGTRGDADDHRQQAVDRKQPLAAIDRGSDGSTTAADGGESKKTQ